METCLEHLQVNVDKLCIVLEDRKTIKLSTGI